MLLAQDDFFANQLPRRSFDVVRSFGFIDHFDDPTEVVERPLGLLTPVAKVVTSVPVVGASTADCSEGWTPRT